MLLATVADFQSKDITVVPESYRELNQMDRIIEALGLLGGHLPSVDEKTLARYYTIPDGEIVIPVHCL